MTINRVRFDRDNPVEGYEEESDINADAVDVRGVYLQNDTSNDALVLVSRDASNNLTFTDPVLGATKTLSQLAAASSGVSYVDWLLQSDPDATNTTYAPTYTGNKITLETWTDTASTNTLKTIAYTYTGNKVTTEIRKVFDLATGLIIIGQITLVYSFSGNSVSSILQTRNV